ncbi:MAG: hypothetical protein AAGM33_11270 [Pseudomonadota bacterium]
MRNTAIMLATAGALLAAGTAQADNHASGSDMKGPMVYTSTGTIKADLVGGVGPKKDLYVGATWSEELKINTAEGNMVSVKAQCVGMSMPERRPFERHVTCDMDDGDGGKGSVIYGCNPDVDPATMRCMGMFEGKGGSVDGHASLVTAFYKFNDDGTGTVQGSGHWIR